MEVKINLTTEESAVEFTATGAFTVIADGLAGEEKVFVKRKGVDGKYHDATNEKGAICLSSSANTITVNVVGTFDWQLLKEETKAEAGVGTGA